MFNSKLVRFILKRLLICFILLSIFDMVMIENRWSAFCGLAAGAIISAMKFCGSAAALAGFFGIETRAGRGRLGQRWAVVIFLLNQLILLPLLFLAYNISQWVFWGFVAGILTIPMLIMLNSITEAFGITRNHFGERV
ncbi:MAG TPA: hypothetical protein VHT96_16380 [Clostridia bacterium]|nr:hypothetical protein [Clostridia bacterium]